jgi:hypothetical protein
MPGTSCRQCVFARKKGKMQIDCDMDRLQLPHLQVIDNEETHYILTDNICTAFRPISWVKDGEDSVERVKKELFPRVQLFVIVDNDKSTWKVLDNPKLSEYFRVDIVYTGATNGNTMNFLATNKLLLQNPNMRIHYSYSTIESQINNLVDKNSMYYMVVSERDFVLPWNFLQKLDSFINDDLKVMMGILTDSPTYNGCLIPTILHKIFDGFGSQSMVEKIRIDSQNQDYTEYVFSSIEEFMNA